MNYRPTLSSLKIRDGAFREVWSGFSPCLHLPCHHQTSVPVKGVSGADNPDLQLILSVGQGHRPTTRGHSPLRTWDVTVAPPGVQGSMWTLRNNSQGRRIICQANSPSRIIRGSWPKGQKRSSGSTSPRVSRAHPLALNSQTQCYSTMAQFKAIQGTRAIDYTEDLRSDLKGKDRPAHPQAQLVERDEIVIQGLEASHCTLFLGCTRGGSLGVPGILKCFRTSSLHAL